MKNDLIICNSCGASHCVDFKIKYCMRCGKAFDKDSKSDRPSNRTKHDFLKEKFKK